MKRDRQRSERSVARPMPEQLSEEERRYLLTLARQSIQAVLNRNPKPKINLETLTPALRQNGASFVTLTRKGRLRGCIGTLEAHQPLAIDVQTRAIQAATEDYRFDPLSPAELDQVKIEISRLTAPVPLVYDAPEQLPARLVPHRDGVVLEDGHRRATFLPQVWEELPDPREFLSHLCLKMGAPADLWQHRLLEVSIYQVEEFSESDQE